MELDNFLVKPIAVLTIPTPVIRTGKDITLSDVISDLVADTINTFIWQIYGIFAAYL